MWSAKPAASRARLRGTRTASASGPAATAVSVTAGGGRSCRRLIGTTTAATSAAPASARTTGRQREERLGRGRRKAGASIRGRLETTTRVGSSETVNSPIGLGDEKRLKGRRAAVTGAAGFI